MSRQQPGSYRGLVWYGIMVRSLTQGRTTLTRDTDEALLAGEVEDRNAIKLNSLTVPQLGKF